jgi:tRNA (adenine37-N6)-methyltransferase
MLNQTEFHVQPIGVIHTPFTDPAATPIQSARSTAVGSLVVDPAYADGLQDVEGFSHLILLYLFHQSAGYALRVTPFLDHQSRGLFATRYPARPNPIGLSVVRLLARHDNRLDIVGVDMFDGTPLLDIKPYVAEFDVRADTRAGWYDHRPLP